LGYGKSEHTIEQSSSSCTWNEHCNAWNRFLGEPVLELFQSGVKFTYVNTYFNLYSFTFYFYFILGHRIQ
jgi:hypothetical protein